MRFFDAGRGTLSEPQLIPEAFSKRTRQTCAAVIEPLGFAPDGEIVLTAAPFVMLGEDQPEADSCVRQKGLWLFDLASQTWSALPDDYKVQRYGKYLGENENHAATSSYVTRGAAPPTDPPASPSAPERNSPRARSVVPRVLPTARLRTSPIDIYR